MKTKEFIKQVRSLGYEVTIKYGEAIISICSRICIRIDLTRQFGIYVYPDNLSNNAHRLFVICMEYARTPIDAREKEEKYYLRLKDAFYAAAYGYLNLDIDEKAYILHDRMSGKYYQTKFTQEEIDAIKEKFNTDLEEFKQIPVKEIEVE